MWKRTLFQGSVWQYSWAGMDWIMKAKAFLELKLLKDVKGNEIGFYRYAGN